MQCWQRTAEQVLSMPSPVIACSLVIFGNICRSTSMVAFAS